MKRKLIVLFVSALVFRFVLAPLIWHPDLNNHVDWGVKFFEYGVNKFYAPESNVWAFTWPNQPPGTILIFAVVRKVYEFIFSAFWQINTSFSAFPSGVITWMDDYLYPVLLKTPAIIADLGIAYLIYKIVLKLKNNRNLAFIGATLFLFNPVIWYNSAIWGQSDSTINFLALFSLYLLLTKKPILAGIVFAICLYIKISLIIFLPLLAILFIKQKFAVKKTVLAVLLPLLLILVATLPFTDGKEPIGWLVSLYREKVLTNQMQVITANAFNLWATLTGIHEQPHSMVWGMASFQNWGSLLFLLAFIPLLYKLWKSPKFETAIWAFALTSFSSWMLLTNMHERYLYPLFPYFTILVALYMALLPIYIGVSIINILNLYNLWWWPEITIIKNMLFAGNRFAPRVLGAINFVLYLGVYSQFLKVKNEKR